ncbi:MAG: zf-HC2 domain-containing protein [Chloroflexota bacterium]|nr:zf-HC2 domain-containing protein [Chloroflexota bacterium]
MFGRQPKNGCQKSRETFSPYLDGCLDAVDEDMLRYHLEVCEECQRELDTLRITRDLLHGIRSVSVPRSFTLAELPSKQTWNPFTLPSMNWMRAATVAAVLVLTLTACGDLTGLFHTEIESQAPEVAIDVTESGEVASPGVESSDPVVQGTENVSEDPWDNREAAVPDPSTKTVGIAQNAAENSTSNGAEESLSPTLSSDSSIEVTSEAYPWLRPLQIVSAALVAIFGGICLLDWRKKHKPLF